MYSTVAWRAAARVGQGWWSRHSPFREAKNDSASALSQHWPVRPVDRQTARSSARVASSPLVYWAGNPCPSGTPPRRGITGGDRVGQRVAGQLGAQLLGQGEADHPAGGDVDHGGQVQPAFPGRDVVMSPHQRVLTAAALTVKSLRIR